MVDDETEIPPLPGWKLASESMTPMQKYEFLEKAKTVTPDWSTISILKMHLSRGHKVGRYGIRFCNTYYQADELAYIGNELVDILFHKVCPPYVPSSVTVIHNNRYLCEAFPAEKRHLVGDAAVDVMCDSDRQNKPAQEMHSTISRIHRSADSILPDNAKSTPSEKNQLYDFAYAPPITDEGQEQTTAPLHRNEPSAIQKGLAFLFGEDA